MLAFPVGSFVLLLVGGLGACSSSPPATATRPLPTLTLAPGSAYFAVVGTPRPVMTRNITGPYDRRRVGRERRAARLVRAGRDVELRAMVNARPR